MAESVSPGELNICPHGNLPGICKECLTTEKGKEKQLEIRNDALEIGSEIAKDLWEELAQEGEDPSEYIYDVVMVLGSGFREPHPDFGKTTDTTDRKPSASSRLSLEFRMRLNAAAQMYLEGRTRVICLMGGSRRTPSGKAIHLLLNLLCIIYWKNLKYLKRT